MWPPTASRPRSPYPRGACLVTFLIGLGVACGARPGTVQEPTEPVAEALATEREPLAQRPGRLLRLRLPVTGSADSAFRSIVERTKTRLLAESDGTTRPVIVIEFVPLNEGDGYGQGTDFALRANASSLPD